MVSARSNRKDSHFHFLRLHFLCDDRMAITFLLLLLLMVSLTSASALKEGQSAGIDADPRRVDQIHSNTLNAKLRLRRAPRYAVCKSRKCRVLNSGNALPQLSNRKLAEGAAKAQDPYGFGR